jgi:hypothetical protein
MKCIYKVFDSYFDVDMGEDGFKRILELYAEETKSENATASKNSFVGWYSSLFGHIEEVRIITLKTGELDEL